MKIFSIEQVREWDKVTISEERISSWQLMERAAQQLLRELEKFFSPFPSSVYVFCGPGNNGGDGAALARMLSMKHCAVTLILPSKNMRWSDDLRVNLEKIQGTTVVVSYYNESKDSLLIEDSSLVLDCIFGSGLNRPVDTDSIYADMIDYINQLDSVVVSIDIPSGMMADILNHEKDKIVRADYTFTIQMPKKSFFFYENYQYTGEVRIVDIGLSFSYYQHTPSSEEWVTRDDIGLIFRKRKRNTHKGSYGRVLLVAGSEKAGAALLAARAALRSGCGLLFCMIKSEKHDMINGLLPEAITLPPLWYNSQGRAIDLSSYDCIAIGPGIGITEENERLLRNFLHFYTAPMVFDADALTLLAHNPTLLSYLPKGSILTPHPGEFERMFGKTFSTPELYQKAQDIASKYGIYLLYKNYYSVLFTPHRKKYFITNGSAGMARGGSGDVLTGILASLLAQGYTPEETAILGGFIHAQAGTIAARKKSVTAMLPSDMIEELPEVFLQLEN